MTSPESVNCYHTKNARHATGLLVSGSAVAFGGLAEFETRAWWVGILRALTSKNTSRTRRDEAMSIADEGLANRVRSTLASDKRISGQPIEVRASAGDVFLKGVVDNLEQRDVAQFIAGGIPGVRRVNVDEVEVREASA